MREHSPDKTALRDAVRKLSERNDLTRTEAYDAMDEIMQGEASSVLVAGFLLGLRAKGETVDEIIGCARALRERAVKIKSRHEFVVDTCGTGGDGSGTFNISTAAAIIASAAGVPVAKHGNRAVSSSCGSADVLQALGINIENPPEKAAEILNEVGITFLFAPMFHGAMKHAAPVRKELGVKTIFNILGPLANPAGATRQILGVFRKELTEPLAWVLKELGSDHAMVLHGEGGLDELSILGGTRVSEVRSGNVRTYEIHAGEFGFEKADTRSLSGGDAQRNAEIIMGVLDGVDGAPADIVAYNAGAAIIVGGKASSMKEGLQVAREMIRSKAAKKKLEQWKEASRS